MYPTLKDRAITALTIMIAMVALGAILSLIAWDLDYLFTTPGLVGTFLCVLAGVFDRPTSVGETDASEERVRLHGASR